MIRVDSPIEYLMVQALLSDTRFGPLGVSLETQVDIRVHTGKRYRLDILIRDNWSWRGMLVVECDGEAYHSNKSQIKHDKIRDRLVWQTFGVNTLRFTGRQIRNNMRGCLNRILHELYKLRGR